jgi:hypothetical protein
MRSNHATGLRLLLWPCLGAPSPFPPPGPAPSRPCAAARSGARCRPGGPAVGGQSHREGLTRVGVGSCRRGALAAGEPGGQRSPAAVTCAAAALWRLPTASRRLPSPSWCARCAPRGRPLCRGPPASCGATHRHAPARKQPFSEAHKYEPQPPQPPLPTAQPHMYERQSVLSTAAKTTWCTLSL